jgi:hypothetical protein
MNNKIHDWKECNFCSVKFTPIRFVKGRYIYYPSTKYCSKQCNALAYHYNKYGKPSVEKRICEYCRKYFINDKWHPKAKFCSKECCDRHNYAVNRDIRILKTKEWISKNKVRVRAYHRKNYKNHIERHRINKRLRNTASITNDQWDKICNDHEYRCAQCFDVFDYKKRVCVKSCRNQNKICLLKS